MSDPTLTPDERAALLLMLDNLESGAYSMHPAMNARVIAVGDIQRLRSAITGLAHRAAEITLLQALYDELLYAVVRKFPGETRHHTALRYLRETEERAVRSDERAGRAEE